MFGNAFGWPHLLLILAVVILLFGAAKLPALAKSVGQSARVFKREIKDLKDESADASGTDESGGAKVTSQAEGRSPSPLPD